MELQPFNWMNNVPPGAPGLVPRVEPTIPRFLGPPVGVGQPPPRTGEQNEEALEAQRANRINPGNFGMDTGTAARGTGGGFNWLGQMPPQMPPPQMPNLNLSQLGQPSGWGTYQNWLQNIGTQNPQVRNQLPPGLLGSGSLGSWLNTQNPQLSGTGFQSWLNALPSNQPPMNWSGQGGAT